MKITWFHREHRPGVFSIEEVFNGVRQYLPGDVEIHDYNLPAGTWPARIKAIRDVKNHAGEVNHITGDVNFLALGLPPDKTIITVHDIGHYEVTLKGLKRSIYGKLWFDLPLKRVKLITTISAASKRKLIKYFHIDPSKIRVIRNPAPEEFGFKPKKAMAEKPKILQIGGGVNKNIERLIEATRGLSCELILIRKPDERLKRLLKSAGLAYTFHYNLTYKQVYQKYLESDMLYFASTYEGFGVPILEAQSTGKPVLTSSLEPMPEVAGDGAHYVDPYSIDEIRAGILRIMEDEEYRRKLVVAGRKNIKRFDPEKIAGQYYRLYKEILEK